MAARINELRQKRIEAAATFQALLDQHLTAAQAGNRGFTPEDKAAQAEAKLVVTNLDELIAAEQLRLDGEKAAAVASPTIKVSVAGPNLVDDPRKGFRSHRDFLLAVMQHSGHRDRAQVPDERLRLLAQADKDDKQAAGELAFMLPVAFTPRFLAAAGSDEQGEYSDPFGGFAITTTRLPGILQVGFDGDPTAGLTQSVPMASVSVELAARTDKDHTTSVSGGFTVTRRAETALIAASRGQMELITLKATSLFGLGFATEELLADSPISFVAIMESAFRDEFAAHMLSEKLRGGGGNEYLGILTALASAGLGPTISIAKEAGQTADSIVAMNAIKMAARCWGFGNSIWLANHDTRPQMYTLAIPVGVGGTLIYQPSREKGFPDMLLGRPVHYNEFASKVGDVGDLILANFSQYLDGIYQPMQSAESVHVRFLNHERAFKCWLRNAGAPWWKTPLTPAKSAETLSPFVVLADRA